MTTHHAWTLLLLLVVTLAPASAKQERLRDELITVLQSDAEMHTAIAKAREGLAAFWEVIAQRKHHPAGAAMARATEGESTRNFLTGLLQHKAGKIFTALGIETTSFKSFRLGAQINALAADLGGWLQSAQERRAPGVALRRWAQPAVSAELEWVRQFLAVP